jgi:hypothetical protein
MRIRKLRWRSLFRLSGMVAASSFLGLGLPVAAHAGTFADMWSGGNAYSGYPNTSYSPVIPAGVPQAQVGVLPTGAYASQYYRVPTTYYRPVTSFDPRLGTTVTSLQPCTSYQYQAQRVPLLVPETQSTAAYGSYGVSPQSRLSPGMVTTSNASASGQSTMSIPSGMGSQYTAPVVQMPTNGIAMYTQSPTQVPQTQFMPQTQFPPTANTFGQPSVPVYGGVQYGPTAINPNPSYNTTVTSPVATAVVPAAAWTTTTTNGGYIGNGPQQFSQPAISSQPSVYSGNAVTSGNAIVAGSGASNGVAYNGSQYNGSQYNAAPVSAPQYGPGATMTPLGPPVISSVPANQNAPAFGPMPGSMGSSVMPGSVYPSTSYPPSTTTPGVSSTGTYPSGTYPPSSVYPSTPSTVAPSLRDSESSVAPQLPPTTLKPILPSESTYAPSQQPTEIMPSNILPDTTDDPNRFQLRRVERDMIGPSTSQGASPNAAPPNGAATVNPFGSSNDPQTLNKPYSETDTGAAGSNPALMPTPSLEKPAGNETTPSLEMKLESLKPIPAPPSFDASPTWRPVLLTPRDQTAGLPDRAPSPNYAASHSIATANPVIARPSRAPAPANESSMSIEEELNSNLVYFNRSHQTRKP